VGTSLDEHEPIVASWADAIACYSKTKLEVLAINQAPRRQ